MIDKKRKKFGIAAAIGLVMVIGIGITLLDRMLPQVKTPQETMRVLEEGEYLFTELDDLGTLLEQNDIHTIIIPEGIHAVVDRCFLQKDIVVEQGGMLETGYMELDGSGTLRVEGTLDIRNAVLRLRGEKACISVTKTGRITESTNTLIWAEDDANIALESSYVNKLIGHHLVFGEEQMFENAVSVSTQEELIAAAKGTLPIRIDAQIRVVDEIHVGVPLLIGEGASLELEDAKELTLEGGVFVNYGSLTGGCCLKEGVFAVNYGTAAFRDETAAAFWQENGTLYLNMGTMECGNSSCVWEGAGFYNAGMLNAYHFLLMGGNGYNYGEFYAKADNLAVSIQNGSSLYNYGTFTAEEDARVENNGWIENAGSFVVENDVQLDNNVFYNRNYFESGFSSVLDEKSGIYYGNGEFRMNGIANVAVWKTLDWSMDDAYQSVATEEELAAAMEDSEVSAVVISKPIEVTGETEITKPVFVRGRVSARDDTPIVLKNTYMVLLEDGSIETQDLRMDNSLIVAPDGDLALADAQILLDNGSAITIYDGQTDFSGSNIMMEEKSVISLSFLSEITADNWSLNMDEARFICNSNVSFGNAAVQEQKESYLQLMGKTADFSGCRIAVDDTSEFHAFYTDLSLKEQCVIGNEGVFAVTGFPENVLSVDASQIINSGRMIVRADLRQTDGSIQNDGEISYE